MATLVTGATGFIGAHVASALLAGRSVIAEGRGAPSAAIEALTARGVRYRSAELGDALPDGVDAVVHLAGVRRVHSDADVYAVNVVGLAKLCEAIARTEREIRLVIVGSSAMYGDAAITLTEEAPLSPATAYGVSKAAADMIGLQRFKLSGAPVLRARPFNVIGSGQRGDFFTAVCARQLVEIERGVRPPVLSLGNLDAARDFVDVRDVAAGIVAILDRGVPGEAYNICSGRATPLREVVDHFVRALGCEITVESKPRTGDDVPLQCGSFAKLEAHTQWTPRYTLDETLRDVLDDWRAALQS